MAPFSWVQAPWPAGTTDRIHYSPNQITKTRVDIYLGAWTGDHYHPYLYGAAEGWSHFSIPFHVDYPTRGLLIWKTLGYWQGREEYTFTLDWPQTGLVVWPSDYPHLYTFGAYWPDWWACNWKVFKFSQTSAGGFSFYLVDAGFAEYPSDFPDPVPYEGWLNW